MADLGIAAQTPAAAPAATPPANNNQGGGSWLGDMANKIFGSKPATPPADPNAPNYVDDGTLDSNSQTCTDVSKQPLVPPGGDWDGQAILNSQSQLETAHDPNQNNQEMRCGESAVLAGAVMSGPKATMDLTQKLAGTPYLQSHPDQGAVLDGVQQRLANGTATHGDLSNVQQMMYNAYGQPNNGGTLNTDVTKMQGVLADKQTIPAKNDDPNSDGAGYTQEKPSETQARINNLQNGQSFIMNVKTSAGDDDVHHFVTVGRDNNGKNYVYDPYPRDNQPNVVYSDKDGGGPFNHYVYGAYGPTTTNGTPANAIIGGTQSWNNN